MRPMMIKSIAALLLTGVAAVADLPAEVYVNGVRQDFQPPAQVRNGVAYAPLRAAAEAIGAQVTWDEPAHRAVVRHAERTIRVSLAEGIAVEGRLLVPLRWFAEALGAEVTWEKDRGRVVIRGLSTLPRYSSPPAQSSAHRYMEVWLLVLTSQTFLLRVPTDQDEPQRLSLQVDMISEDGRTVRVAHVTAHWERTRWPQDLAVHAAVDDELPATQPHAAWVAEIPIEPTEPGTYHFKAEVTQGAMAGTSFSVPEVIVHEQPDWLHAQAGIEGLERVLAPWTPVEMEVAGGTHVVSCWNRQIILKDDSLVDQIMSGDHMLLAAPLELDAWDAAGDRLKAQASWTPVEQREVHVSLTRRWASDQSHLDVTLTKEYDGLTWLEMRIGGGVGIERLDLVLPLVRETVPLIYYFPDVPWYWGNIQNVIRTPRPSMGWSASWRRWVWLGGMEAGLFFWLTDRKHVQQPDDPNVISIESGTDGEVALMRVRVLRGPEVTTEGEYEFAFQATPVKPWPADPLHNRVSTFHWSEDSALGILDRLREVGYQVVHIGEWWTTAWGGTTPRDPEALRRLTAAAHEREMQVIVYFGFNIDDTLEDFQKYAWELLGGRDPRVAGYRPERFYPPARFDPDAPYAKAYINDRSGVEKERLLAGMQTLLTDYQVDGFYLDGTQLPSDNLRGSRELMKRMRYLADTHGTRGIIYAHTSSRNNIAVNSFADVVFNGEQLRAVERHTEQSWASYPRTLLDYQDYLFLLMNGHPWGVPHDLCDGLPEHVNLAYLLDTGTLVYQWSEDRLPMREVWLDADLWRADYTAPHVAGARWTGQPPDLHVSYYRSRGDIYTVALYNAQAGDVEVTLPVHDVLGLDQGLALGEPQVVHSDSEAQWKSTDDGWQGVVPSGRAVLLRAGPDLAP